MTGLSPRLRQGGVYLITGGTGGIGRQMALWLARQAGARLVLLARRATSHPGVEADIAAMGGEALLLDADLTDEAAVSAAITAARARFGAIHGVIHAAGVLHDAPLSAKSLAEAEALMAPKLRGARLLDRLLPEGSVDLFAVISSSSVVIGGAGQTDYVAANAMLEALAASRSDGLSIAWGVWRDTGMAARIYGAGEQHNAADTMLGQRSDAADGTISFARVVDPETDWRVAEHVVGGKPVLPGTAYIDMAQAAALAAFAPGDVFELHSLSLLQPMIFATPLPRRVTVALRPNRQGFDLTIESTSGAPQSSVEHARCQITLVKAADRTVPAALSTPVDLPRAVRSGRPPQDALISFGARWSNVGDVHAGADQAMGRFDLPPAFAADLAQHPLHPGLLDMAATVGLHMLPEEAMQGLVYAPMSVDRCRVFAPLPATVTSRAVRVAGEHRKFVAFDVLVSAEDGTPVMMIERLALRAVDGGMLDAATGAPPLTEQLLSTGIRAREAASVFPLVFGHAARQIVVSPVSLDMVRLAMIARTDRRPPVERPRSAGGEIGNPLTARIAAIWGEILGIDAVGEEDDFFALGGHSLNAVRMFGQIRKEFGVNLPLATLFEAPRVRDLAALLGAEDAPADAAEAAGAGATTRQPMRAWSPLVVISKGSEVQRPFYCVHGAGGNVLNFRPLAGFLDPSIPFVGLRAYGSDGAPEVDGTIEAMAERYLDAIREFQPKGPYRFSGYSGGGVIAYEMAQRLQRAGETVERLVFFDTLAPHVARQRLTKLQKLWAARKWDWRFAMEWRNRRRQSQGGQDDRHRIAALIASGSSIPEELRGQRMTEAYSVAQAAYAPLPYAGEVIFFRARQASTQFIAAGPVLGWDGLLTGPVTNHLVECNHFTMMAEPAIGIIGRHLNELLGLGNTHL
ncbi:MAG: SDR family NAD(P)-dependent oxidoreductase [Tabrizicola sp.]|nr:SDR family NAD(P)-dependent oxidoreductase [Tabrizicola sp.]